MDTHLWPSLGKGGSWIQNTLAPPCGSRWRCHGRERLGLILFLLIPFLFKQWWSGGRVGHKGSPLHTALVERHKFLVLGGAPPTDSVLEPEFDTPQSQVKGGWLLLVCHFLDALQTYIDYFTTLNYLIFNFLGFYFFAAVLFGNKFYIQMPCGCFSTHVHN